MKRFNHEDADRPDASVVRRVGGFPPLRLARCPVPVPPDARLGSGCAAVRWEQHRLRLRLQRRPENLPDAVHAVKTWKQRSARGLSANKSHGSLEPLMTRRRTFLRYPLTRKATKRAALFAPLSGSAMSSMMTSASTTVPVSDPKRIASILNGDWPAFHFQHARRRQSSVAVQTPITGNRATEIPGTAPAARAPDSTTRISGKDPRHSTARSQLMASWIPGSAGCIAAMRSADAIRSASSASSGLMCPT